MKNEEIKSMWEKFVNSNQYKKYFESNETQWMDKLTKVKEYIDLNNKKSLDQWISTQYHNYDIDITKCKYIMKNEEIKLEWENFINSNQYKKYFESNQIQWMNKLIQVKEYIDLNNKKPSNNNNLTVKQLNKWISHQKANYHFDISKCQNIMKNEEIKLEWENFINSNQNIFKI